MKPLLSCKEVSQLVSQGLERRLGLVERVQLRLHLAICEGCSNFKKHMVFLRKALSRLAQ
jgi:Putative zinc-finger